MNKISVSVLAGGAGFIGSNLLSQLVKKYDYVVVIDNLSNGRESYLASNKSLERYTFIQADLANFEQCLSAFQSASTHGNIVDVWHLAANSDIPAGVLDAEVDHKDTFLTTFQILRVMQKMEIKKLNFASSSAIYGDLGNVPLHEAIGPLFPISNYGAMKLASEAQCSAAAESFLDTVNLFRFPNVVGIPATHGVILDFVRRLKKDPTNLTVLGDGTQQKSYLHVSDLINAMLLVDGRVDGAKVNAINIGPVDEGVKVRWIAEQVVARVAPQAEIVFGSGNKGWVGDVPKFTYLTDKLQAMGWSPNLGSEDAVLRAIDEIATQEGF